MLGEGQAAHGFYPEEVLPTGGCWLLRSWKRNRNDTACPMELRSMGPLNGSPFNRADETDVSLPSKVQGLCAAPSWCKPWRHAERKVQPCSIMLLANCGETEGRLCPFTQNYLYHSTYFQQSYLPYSYSAP